MSKYIGRQYGTTFRFYTTLRIRVFRGSQMPRVNESVEAGDSLSCPRTSDTEICRAQRDTPCVPLSTEVVLVVWSMAI